MAKVAQISQRQIEKILKKRFNTTIPALAKEFKNLGFGKQSSVETISSVQDFIALREAPDRTIKLPDGWVIDKYITLLLGKKGLKYYVSPKDLQKHIPWKDGEDYSASCGGKQASPGELLTFIDFTKRNPAIVEGAKILELSLDNWYWTSQELPGFPGCARIVYFKSGYVDDGNKYNGSYVRPVRLSD